MKNITQHTGILRVVDRLPSSRNGNPRWRAFIQDRLGFGYDFVTAVDSLHGYSITNHDGHRVTVTIGTHYGKRTLDSIKPANED